MSGTQRTTERLYLPNRRQKQGNRFMKSLNSFCRLWNTVSWMKSTEVSFPEIRLNWFSLNASFVMRISIWCILNRMSWVSLCKFKTVFYSVWDLFSIMLLFYCLKLLLLCLPFYQGLWIKFKYLNLLWLAVRNKKAGYHIAQNTIFYRFFFFNSWIFKELVPPSTSQIYATQQNFIIRSCETL